jgi:hypothetical protein
VLEDAEVLGHRGLRYAGAIGQGVNCQLPVSGQVLEDGSTGWVGEGLEKIVGYRLHAETITKRLWIVKSFLGLNFHCHPRAIA